MCYYHTLRTRATAVGQQTAADGRRRQQRADSADGQSKAAAATLVLAAAGHIALGLNGTAQQAGKKGKQEALR